MKTQKMETKKIEDTEERRGKNDIQTIQEKTTNECIS